MRQKEEGKRKQGLKKREKRREGDSRESDRGEREMRKKERKKYVNTKKNDLLYLYGERESNKCGSHKLFYTYT